MDIQTSLRTGDLPQLVDLLKTQSDVKYDVVVPASRLRYDNGLLHVVGGAVEFTEDGDDFGAVERDAVLAPIHIFEEGVSERLGIPRKYLQKLRETGQAVRVNVPDLVTPDDAQFDLSLLDANVNGWLQSQGDKPYLVRGFRTDDPDQVGLARAFLSNRYAPIDHLDILTAALSGIGETELSLDSLQISGSLTDRAMRVYVSAPTVAIAAPEFLGEYRSPFNGRSASDLPIVNAGLVLGNSETGGGAATLTPWFQIQVCTNGMTIKRDAERSIHIGAALDEGVIRWTEDTERKTLELVKARTRDAVATFLDVEYLTKTIGSLTEQANTEVSDAVATIKRVATKHLFTEEEQASVLDMFIKGGATTAGGVMQAVTAAAQRIDDPDRAAEFEDMAVDVLATAATAAA